MISVLILYMSIVNEKKIGFQRFFVIVLWGLHNVVNDASNKLIIYCSAKRSEQKECFINPMISTAILLFVEHFLHKYLHFNYPAAQLTRWSMYHVIVISIMYPIKRNRQFKYNAAYQLMLLLVGLTCRCAAAQNNFILLI